MDETTYIKQRQMLWASRKGIKFELRNGGGYVSCLEANLLAPLSPQAQSQFSDGSGSELTGKMLALHSSSAFAANIFDYWNIRRCMAPIAEALDIPTRDIQTLAFEQKHPTCPHEHPEAWRFKKPANLDMEFGYGSGEIKAIGIESKFAEPYGGHKGLSETYLAVEGLWEGLLHCRSLAEKIAPKDGIHECLDAPQLLKHVLSLRGCYQKSFCLIYLWYEAPGSQSSIHRDEIESFAKVLAADGVQFRHLTYQELIAALAEKQRREHTEYVDYLVERYL